MKHSGNRKVKFAVVSLDHSAQVAIILERSKGRSAFAWAFLLRVGLA